MNNLLLADIRSLIAQTFADQLTSMDFRVGRIEKASVDYENSKAALKALFARLKVGLEKLGEAQTNEQREKVQTKLIKMAAEDIGTAFGEVMNQFCGVIRAAVDEKEK